MVIIVIIIICIYFHNVKLSLASNIFIVSHLNVNLLPQWVEYFIWNIMSDDLTLLELDKFVTNTMKRGDGLKQRQSCLPESMF